MALGEHGFEQRVAEGRAFAPQACAAHRFRVGRGAHLRGCPQCGGGLRPVRQRRSERLIEDDGGDHGELRALRQAGSESFVVTVQTLPRSLRQPGEVIVMQRAERADEPAVDLRLGERAVGRGDDGMAEVEDVVRELDVENVHSCFSYWVSAGST